MSSQEVCLIQLKCAYFSLLLIQEELNVFLLGILGSATIFSSNMAREMSISLKLTPTNSFVKVSDQS
jgi:hypothetical protein